MVSMEEYMQTNEQLELQEFLDWLEDNKYNLPEWINPDFSIYQCRILWREKIKNAKRIHDACEKAINPK